MSKGFISVAASGVAITTGAASAVAAIPNDASGNRARRVRLQALATCYVRPGFAGTTCTTGDLLLTPYEAVLLDVTPFTHIAHLQQTAGAVFVMTPVEG
ncbi:MAG: hypothetical protein IRZ04_08220 [Rhodospirillales bacterium]|nr:hypothetical protein [Rhodospirillales bacterium]